jgi:peptidase M15-like protein
MTALDFHQLLMMLDARFSFSETSGKRTPGHNQAVGGQPESRHCLWLARDLVLDDAGDTEAFTKEAKRQGLVVVDEGDHLHVQSP